MVNCAHALLVQRNNKGASNATATPQTRQQVPFSSQIPQAIRQDQGRKPPRAATRRLAPLATRTAVPCFHPITAVQHHDGGKLEFPQLEHLYLYNDYRTLQIPCGQCSGCRLRRSRHWAIRCMHEKQMHKHSCYLTLTYDSAHLPRASALQYSDFQAFMRKLRKATHPGGKTLVGPPGMGVLQNLALLYEHVDVIKGAPGAPQKTVARPAPLKFYMCGEYGPTHGRPHYHALIFGVDFNDRLFLKNTSSSSKIYTSPTLSKLWDKGFSSVGDLTFQSAAYIARYVMKKRTGDGDNTNYNIIDPDTGEIILRRKEFNQMSRRPGIGSSWLDKFASDVYTTGKLIAGGHPQYPPRYYDKQYAKRGNLEREELEDLKYQRLVESLQHIEHHTPERLIAQEQVQDAKTRRLQRNQPWENS